MRGQSIQIGESFVGEGAEAAHVNTVLGEREGPVGTAWATSLATPRVADGVITAEEAESTLLIAAVWVNPAAKDAQLVYRNNRAATRSALEAGLASTPTAVDMLAARDNWLTGNHARVMPPRPVWLVC